MSLPKRFVPLLAIASFIVLLFFYHNLNVRGSWRDIPQAVGLGETVLEPGGSKPSESDGEGDSPDDAQHIPQPAFKPGTAKPAGSNYTRILVVPRMSEEDVNWLSEELPDVPTAIYVADDPTAPLHPPKNKGHEVMIYLTYIIDHYHNLADVMVFMHSHRWSWHNDDILDNDGVQMIKRLSSERVTREGYMNLRCHWDPGCPDWMHPGATEEDINKQEETMLARSWSELFPLDPIPNVLAQPCCAQFALSRDRIHSIPLSRFIFYRDWLLRTSLSDYISGRVWEYIWQFVFTGENVFCPAQHACYCDGFGVCFGGEVAFNDWFETRYKKRQLESELRDWEEKGKAIEGAKDEGRLDDAAQLEVPEMGRDVLLRSQIDALNDDLNARKVVALERGNDPRNRAEESGRVWNEGDGF
ncbi:MAG: hypothetical protein M1830_009415 [Pleopsidium flavum]|nr:MAG: hypothetical protein M1830_009415 [Pleopsidium flavum]